MDQKVRREILETGVEYTIPPDGAVCHLQVSDDAHGLFTEKEATIKLGLPSDHERLALEESVMKMRPGEKNRIELRSTTCAGDPDATKAVTLKLKHFNGCQVFEMDTGEKWRLANWHKNRGVSLFTEGNLEWSFRQFSLALKYIISLAQSLPKQEHDNQEMNINQLRITLYLNLSLCQLKVKNYQHACENASKALAILPKNSKGLYRRGIALMHLQEYEKSQVDLNAANELEPRNAQIEDALRELRTRMNALDKMYAIAMKKMFL